MKWRVTVKKKVTKALSKMDVRDSTKILKFIHETLSTLENPRQSGKSLNGNLTGYWRYRVGDFRLVCEIHDDELMIVAVDIGHRREIYR